MHVHGCKISNVSQLVVARVKERNKIKSRLNGFVLSYKTK